MPRLSDLAAVGLCLLAFFLSLRVTEDIFDAIPHIEDEMAYAWQAKLYAGGHSTITSPPCPKCFMVPFVTDLNGIRFSKYPPGWPAVLSIGERLHARKLVNPFLTAISIWLIYRLICKFDRPKTALLTCLLVVLSPFTLMNAGSLLSHSWSLFLTLVLTIAWLDTFFGEHRIPLFLTIPAAGISLGLLALTRPLTAAAVAMPFFLHGILLLIKGTPEHRKSLILIGCLTVFFASFYFVWQYDLTGDALQNPYTLIWAYDKIGFGPGHGIQEGGYNLHHAWINLRFSMSIGIHDFLGWPYLSWLFIPFGLFAIRKQPKAWLVSSFLPVLVLTYLLYWIGSWLFGPRYYYEGIISIAYLNAAGITWLAGTLDLNLNHPKITLKTLRFTLVTFIVCFLMTAGSLLYTPTRLQFMHGLYGIRKEQLQPFLSDSFQKLAPAIFIVHTNQRWHEYGALIDLTSPYLDSSFLFTYSRGQELDSTLVEGFPNRAIFHYDTFQPDKVFFSWTY